MRRVGKAWNSGEGFQEGITEDCGRALGDMRIL
jgi:hypothetical protein